MWVEHVMTTIKDPQTLRSSDKHYRSTTDSSGEAGPLPEIKVETVMRVFRKDKAHSCYIYI